jgi:UDP-glucose 4-epimerase
LKDKVFLVTGSAGFIGSAISRRLLDKGYKVVTIDNLSTGNISNIPKETIFIEGDCSDPKIINKLSNFKFEAILHLAGQSSGEVSFEDPLYDLKSNAVSTLLLLEYALNNNCKKIIYASSMSVYGNQKKLPVTEESRLNPLSLYSVGKIASENYLKIYSERGMSNISLRLFNVYGPGQNRSNLKQGMISIYLSQAFDNKKIIIKGPKERIRDFVYIDDVVESFLRVLKGKDSCSYQCYNISTGIQTSVDQVLKKITYLLPFDVDTKFSESTPGDQNHIYGKSLKFQNDFGKISFTTVDEGLSKVIEEYI